MRFYLILIINVIKINIKLLFLISFILSIILSTHGLHVVKNKHEKKKNLLYMF
jgi:hypothetical protein